jgi:hypothetical protein
MAVACKTELFSLISAMIFGLVMQSIIGFALSGAYTPLTQPGRIAGFAVRP